MVRWPLNFIDNGALATKFHRQ